MTKNSVLLIPLLLLTATCNSQTSKCRFNGKVVGRSSSSIYLTDALDRPDRPISVIPIKDSTFTFELDQDPLKAYMLIFYDEFFSSDGLHPIIIFPDQAEIKLILYDSKHLLKNRIYGGKLNAQYIKFKNELQSKYNYDSTRVLNQTNDVIQLYKKINSWCYNYFDQNPSIVSYYLILDQFGFNFPPFDEKYSDYLKFKDIVKRFAVKFPNHPYNIRTNDFLTSQDKIKVGGEFIDFTLPDIYGKNYTLSECIKGKIALIDLWATWCHSCILTSRSLIPVYNEFKNSGFTIIGIVNEIENTNNLKIALQREKFPWINLVELNNQHSVWAKYSVANSGGGTFLVDKEGKILAIDPSVEEIRNILNKK